MKHSQRMGHLKASARLLEQILQPLPTSQAMRAKQAELDKHVRTLASLQARR